MSVVKSASSAVKSVPDVATLDPGSDDWSCWMPSHPTLIAATALEIVEGKLKPTDVRRRVREYVTAQFRQCSKFGPISLDARLKAASAQRKTSYSSSSRRFIHRRQNGGKPCLSAATTIAGTTPAH
jgi:hypothetical protein